MEDVDKPLLTILLVGQTTAWHNSRDLGITHLRTAKRLNNLRLVQQIGGTKSNLKRQNEFFEKCILYWDMLAGFVDDNVDNSCFGDIAGSVISITPGL